MREREALEGQSGFAIIEVLMGTLVAGIVIVGLALMFGLGQSWVVAEGDNRVALYLAQQKVEKLKAIGFTNVPVGNGSTGGCGGATEPCYTETAANGNGISAGAGGTQVFGRVTCVDYIDDTNPVPATCDPTRAATQTKRIRVDVTSPTREADSIRLEALVTCPPSQNCCISGQAPC